MEMNKSLLSVSPSPHVRDDDSVQKIMWTVIFALAPAAIFGAVWFGTGAIMNLIAGSLSAVLFEFAVQKIRKIEVTISDGSAFLTGLLLAMCVPPGLPIYMTIVGSFVGVVVAKHAMGGLGYNVFNPAHIGRAAIMVSYPVAMTTWTSLKTSADVVTTATPLNILKQQGYDALISTFGSQHDLYQALFLGFRNGSIGETSAVLLLLGGLFLIWKKIVNWEVPVFMIGTVAILTWIFGPGGLFTGDPIFHVLAGGLIIGAFFMATDMVTIPITRKGQIMFAVGAGMLVVLIRLKGGYPEGVCYSILIMNAVTPLIDRFVRPRKYGSGGAK
jgi:Na+-translocating ferredoxin:NAD+ oxidoreductase subunit D